MSLSKSERILEELSIPKFDDISVSTKTVIADTNLRLDIVSLFDHLPITPYALPVKRRGRKKQVSDPDPNAGIINGGIVTIKYELRVRGVVLKPSKGYFRNVLTVVVVNYLTETDRAKFGAPYKLINVKLAENGKLQITGAKSEGQAAECVKHLWGHIEASDHYHMAGKLVEVGGESGLRWESRPIPGERPRVVLNTAMTNIDFALQEKVSIGGEETLRGFNLCRSRVDEYINLHTPYRSLLDLRHEYTGVNVKFPVDMRDTDFPLCTLELGDEGWVSGSMLYSEYLGTLDCASAARLHKKNESRFNTFLVFHSGKVIMSGMNEHFMRADFEAFVDIIRKNKEELRERLIETDDMLSLASWD